MTTTNTDTVAAITASQLHHARLKKATKLAGILDAEYPAITLQTKRDEHGRVTGWFATHTATETLERTDTEENDAHEEAITRTSIYEGDKVPELADLLEVCEEKGLDPESGADEEEARSGSIVPEQYRKRYHESSSNGQSCGDWLAEWLTDQTWSAVNGLMVEDFTAVLNANGVDMTRPWARLPESGQNGWRGRYRMNGRQSLEKHVALNGYVYTAQGEEVEVPSDALAVLRERHAKWIAKQEKAQAAADSLTE